MKVITTTKIIIVVVKVILAMMKVMIMIRLKMSPQRKPVRLPNHSSLYPLVIEGEGRREGEEERGRGGEREEESERRRERDVLQSPQEGFCCLHYIN